MGKLLLGVLLASLAVYTWGFIYWGALTVSYSAWKQAPDDKAAGQALLQHFPESGTYYIPGLAHEEAEMAALFEAGPVGFVHIHREGRPMVDPRIMGLGFGHVLLVNLVLALLLKTVGSALPSYAARVKFAALVGLAAVVMVHLGEAVWWGTSAGWKFSMGLYDLIATTVAGLVLAKFVADAE